MRKIAKHSLLLLLAAIVIYGCGDNEIPDDVISVSPPNMSVTSQFLSFAPDSGGVGTQLIIKGKNFGTDTSYLRVTVNGKNAPIVGVKSDVICAIVPARADTGLVKVYVGKGDNIQELTSDGVFRYLFQRSVSTVAGQAGQASREDGAYAQAKFRRPWFVTHDKDDVIYEIDEGRGRNKDGALRRLNEGEVSTLIEDSEGPFQSPTVAAFNAKQDTLFMTHLFNSGNCTSRVGLVAISRESGFVDVNPLVRMDDIEPQLTGLAINPVNGDILFSNNSDGYIYRYLPGHTDDISKSYVRLKRVRNQSGTDMRLVFSPDGTMLYELIKNRHCICRTPYDMANHTLSSDLDEIWAGQWNTSGYQNGIGGAALFDQPSAAEFDEDGNMMVADKYNHCIRRIDPNGEVTLWAGTPRQSGYKDGLPSEAKFNCPEGLTILTDQSIIVADRENQLIRKVVVE